jgi:hypothetical protein
MSAKPPRGKPCYRCGQPGDTSEHVVPRCLYPDKPSAVLITVPACGECNNALAKDEEYFRTLLTTSWIQNPVATAVWEGKTRRSLNREHDGLRKLLLANMRDFYLPSSAGLVRTGLVKADTTRMDRVAEKIVRALHYHVTTRIMSPSTTMRFHWQPDDWLKEMALRANLVNIDPDVFSCRYAIATEGSREVSIWWMLFYRSFMYVVSAHSNCEPLLSALESKSELRGIN